MGIESGNYLKKKNILYLNIDKCSNEISNDIQIILLDLNIEFNSNFKLDKIIFVEVSKNF